jgi:hypothetical protein
MNSIRNRAIAAATAAAIALTTVAITPAAAAPASKPQVETSGATDFSSQRRRSYARGNAAAAGVMLGIIGAVGAYAAAREYRKAHEYRYYDNPGYGYYGGGYGYARPRYYYGY